MSERQVVRVFQSTPTSDGAGVRLNRGIGTAALDHFDPFLLLDEFRSDDPRGYLAGFPDHPHRGFETVTYMLAGSMQHRDHRGHEGHLVAGSVQWMTAGRGIVHSEMPRQRDGLLWGFQLWVNLPAKHKLCEPRYQELAPEQIPTFAGPGHRGRVIAGTLGETVGAVRGIVTAPLFVDLELERRVTWVQPLAAEVNACCYVYQGRVRLADQRIAAGQLALLGPGEGLQLVSEDEPARLLLLAARPLGEPIARHGPFVMNTPEEIAQALRDFQSGRF